MNGGVGLAEVAGRFRRLALQLRYLAMDIDELVMFCQRRFIAVMIHDAPFSPFQSSLVFYYISLSFVLFSFQELQLCRLRFDSHLLEPGVSERLLISELAMAAVQTHLTIHSFFFIFIFAVFGSALVYFFAWGSWGGKNFGGRRIAMSGIK